MLKKISLLSLVLALILITCKEHHQDSQKKSGLKKIAINGLQVNPDSVQKPKIINAGTPKVFSNLKSLTETYIPKLHPVIETVIIRTGIPKIITPGKDRFLLPKHIPAKGLTQRMNMPEKVPAKEMSSKDINPGNFGFYKIQHGLKSNTIRCMTMDKVGNLWFGTYGGGMTCYDGKFFTNFTENQGLPNNFVNCILEDRKGNLWVGTNGAGICRFDGTMVESFSEKQGLVNNYVFSVLEDRKGNIWFSTEGGVTCYNGESFTNYTDKEGLPDYVVWSMLEDKSGNIWFGTEGFGVSCFNGKSFANYSEEQGLLNNFIWSMFEDKKGNIWFGTYGGGVFCFDGKQYTQYTTQSGLANNYVYDISEDIYGALWFATNGGLSRFYKNTFSNFSEKEGLSANSVSCILEDKAKNLWLGTSGGGVCSYSGNAFLNFSGIKMLEDISVHCMLEEKPDLLWFGTNKNGLVYFDGKCFTKFSDKNGLLPKNVWSMKRDKTGNIWIATSGEGAFVYDGKSFKQYTDTQGLANNYIQSILVDRLGKIWFGSNGEGVSCFDGKTFTNYTVKQGLVDNFVLCIIEDGSGNIWFGTNAGLSRFDGKVFTNFSKADGLAGDHILCLLEDKKGNIWAGTNGSGTSLYRTETGRISGQEKCFISFSEQDGLINNSVLNILEDKSNNIWFGTRNGLSKIVSSKLEKLNSEKYKFDCKKEALFYNYGFNEGFRGLNCLRNSVIEDVNGQIWWGAEGLYCLNPEGDIPDKVAPVIKLNKVKLFGEDIDWVKLTDYSVDNSSNENVRGVLAESTLENGMSLKGVSYYGLSRWDNLPMNLTLPFDLNNLSFGFIGVHMQSRNHVKYQYQLEGVDPDWSSVTEKTEASYGNLPSGDYTFKVKAMNQSGVWSETTSFHFVIRPPWWATWWFKGLCVLFIVSAVIYYIKWREDRIKKIKNNQIKSATDMLEVQEQERQRIAADLHDRLGSMLATVKLYFNSVEENIEQLKKVNQEYYAKANTLLDEACVEVRKISHDLASGVLLKLGLVAALNELKDTVTSSDQLKMELRVFGLEKRLPVEMEVNIYRIIQEMLSNTLKHAKATKLSVQLNKIENNLNMIVEDDGIGFDQSRSEGEEGIGLKNIRERVTKLKGKFEIDSNKKGTTLIIDIPIDNT